MLQVRARVLSKPTVKGWHRACCDLPSRRTAFQLSLLSPHVVGYALAQLESQDPGKACRAPGVRGLQGGSWIKGVVHSDALRYEATAQMFIRTYASVLPEAGGVGQRATEHSLREPLKLAREWQTADTGSWLVPIRSLLYKLQAPGPGVDRWPNKFSFQLEL